MDYQPIHPDLLALNDEMQNHPSLMQHMAEYIANNNGDVSLEDKIGFIAAFCGIVVDGYYTPTEVHILASKCVMELRNARAELIADFAPKH